MIQLILILLGLLFSNENNSNHQNIGTTSTDTSSNTGSNPGTSTGDTGGNTGHKPPTIIPKP